MADVITRLRVESSEYDSKIQRAAKGIQHLEDATRRAGRTMSDAKREEVAFVQSLGKMQTVSTSAKGKVSELTTAFTNLSVQYRNLTAQEKASPFGRAMSSSIDQLSGRIRKLNMDIASTQRKLGGMNMTASMPTGGGGGGLGKIGGGFAKGMGGAAAALGPAAAGAAVFSAAMGGVQKVVSDVISINKTFEQSSSNLAAVLGTSREEISALTDQAKQLGATTQYTASQILELQANLARLGFSQEEILNSTKSVQAMATAMGADLGEAANLAGSALRGFGLDATEMERVASVLSVGTTKSALSFEKLATALPIVQTAAAKTGFTIEDTVAMLGKLTDNGINAASAATQLRKILNDSTTAGTKLANALGGPVKSFDELVVALDKANKAGQNHADSVALVNSKNATALDILRDMAAQRTVEIDGVEKQTSALQDLRDAITDCSDGMKSMQDEQLNTLQGSVTMLNSAWEGLMLTFSESNGVLKEVVDSLTNAVQAFTKWRKIYRNGGDEAIMQYEKGVTKEAKQNEDTLIKSYKAGGTTNEEIAAKYASEKAELEKQKEELMKQLGQIEEENSTLTKNIKRLTPVNAPMSMLASTVETKVSGKEDLYKQIAALNDQLAAKDYALSQVTENPTLTTTTAGSGESEDGGKKAKNQTAVLKAQYEEQEKLQIANLGHLRDNEEQYEAEVYRIKRETLQKIADLYQEETAEKARANAAISSLDIQYQGTQMRLANKVNNGTTAKPKEEKLLNYSQEGIANLGSQIKGAMSKSEIGSGDYLLAADQLLDFTTFENLLKVATERGIQPDPEWMSSLFEDIKIGADIDDDTWQAVVDSINEKIAELDLPPIELDVKTGKVDNQSIETAGKDMDKLKTNVEGAIGVFGQLGGAMQQLEDPGAKVAGIIMEAIASVAGSFAKSLMGAVGPWDWIAAAIGGVTTMISTISAIKSATSGGYANGGIIPGNSFSGDNMRGILPNGDAVGLDAGELILNRAQQSNIAGQLNSNPIGNLALSMNLKGEDIQICLDNNSRRRGRK